MFVWQLPKEYVVAIIPCLVQYLGAKSQVVHSYAACAIEKIFTLKAPDTTTPLYVTIITFF